MVDWTKKNIPRADLLAWHMYEAGVSGHNVINDYSGNNRIISCGAGNSPVLTSNVFNGQPGWYFNGSRDPLAVATSIAVRHVFMLASYEDATFSTNFKGLLSGLTNGDIFVANSSGDTFFDFVYAGFDYRKSNVSFAANNQKAPMLNDHQVIEFKAAGGIPMDGIQVGKQKNLAPARLWKGWFFDELMYGQTKNDVERRFIYEYFAQRYWAWERDANGLKVFPFAANRTRDMEHDREHYLSEPYDGDPKALIRGSFKGRYSLPFLLRDQEEFDAAKAFFEQHYPLTKFVFRDYRFYPYRDTVVRFASSFREQGSDVTYRFNYSFDVVKA